MFDREIKVELGQIWQLGKHRLMCADACKESDVLTLVNNNIIDFIYTDPPYGISLNYGKNSLKAIYARNIYQSIVGDDSTNLAKTAYKLIISLFSCPLVYWGANYYDFLPPSKCWIAWDKRPGVKQNSFCGAELAYTNCRKHSIVIPIIWNGIYKGEESGQKRIHPTQKPIKLAIEIFNYLNAGINVLDLFGGSGSTLIAWEKTKRTCYMMEISPQYCELIIKRWEKLTGGQAELLTLR